MIRQDFFGSVQNVKSSLVLISLESLEKLLGFNCSEVPDDPDELEAFAEKSIDKLAVFVDKIKDAGGDSNAEVDIYGGYKFTDGDNG